MHKFHSAIRAVLTDEAGLTAIEYGLLAAVIGAVLVLGASAIGDALRAAFGLVIPYL